MKKRNIVIIIIAVLLVIALLSTLAYYIIIENGKKYEIEEVNNYNYFVLKKDNSYGVINRNGEIVVTPEYTEVKIPNPEKAVFVCYQDENIKVFNDKQEELFTQYSEVEPIRLQDIASDLMYEKSVLKYVQDSKYGLIDFTGKQITKPIYDEIDSLSYKEGELLVKQGDLYGVINIKGNELVETKYNEIEADEYYTEENNYKYAGYIISVKTQEGYRYGYINEKGKQILETEYNEISRVNEIEENENAYLICAKNGQYGVIKNQETIINNEYQSISYDETNKVFVVEKSKKYGIANLEGKIIIPVKYNQIDITGVYLYAQNEQGTTVYNSDGSQANVDVNIAIINTSNEKYKIKINNKNGTKYGVINQEGKQLISEKYNYIEYLYDNYFIVSNESGKLGILDDKEKIKVEVNNDSLQKIQGTDLIQTVSTDNGIISIYNRAMVKICEMQNASVTVTDNYIKIVNEAETKYFSKEGKKLQNTEVYPNNKLFVKSEGNQYGFVDNNGNLVVQCKYDKAYEFNEYGFATVKKDGKWGVINEQGQEIVAPTYEITGQNEPSFIGSYYRVTYGFGEFYYTDDM